MEPGGARPPAYDSDSLLAHFASLEADLEQVSIVVNFFFFRTINFGTKIYRKKPYPKYFTTNSSKTTFNKIS
jgi:hypothetical protein